MKKSLFVLTLCGLMLSSGCGGPGTTRFVHPEFDFGFIERVAVVPFENLSANQGAGARATRYFISSLLAAESFDVVEPGEVARALEKHALVRTAQLTEDQILTMGRDLGVQGLFLGTLSES